MGNFRGEKHIKQIFLKGVTTGGSGKSYADPKPLSDGDLWEIPADCVIDNVYVIIDTAVTGTTDLDVGDDDDADGYVDGSGSLTLGTPALYSSDPNVQGVYLKAASGREQKYYSATGKELKLDATGTNTAGEVRVVVEYTMLREA